LIEAWIDKQLKGTSVTVVLIGAETSQRQHVGYEIKQSHNEGKGMLGVYIHGIKDANSKTDSKGSNPFANWNITRDGKKLLLSEIYPTYDWVNDNGRENLGGWIETAAKKAGR
jgi:antiphage defense system Thoeris ThsB-like protein